MDKKKIWLSSPHMGGKELQYINEAFRDNWIAPLGPHVNGLEADLASYTGIPFAAALSSGTAALHLALVMLGVKPNDKVVCSSFTFSASANAIAYQFAEPVFVDSEEDTWNMDPQKLEEALSALKKAGTPAKAVMVVHLYGMISKIEEITSICSAYDVPIIEDAAEALGTFYKGKHAGSWGAISAFSFNGNKIITTSGGGALVSNSEEHVKQARFLSTQARDNAPHYEHSHIGYNYRMSNICAAIGRGQMEVLEHRVQQRIAIFERYKKELSDLPGISFQPDFDGCRSTRWLTCVTIYPTESGGIDREQLRLAMAEQNIDARPLWKPMHMQPVFAARNMFGGKVCERLFDQGLCLPSGTNMEESDWDRILTTIHTVWKKQMA